MNMIIPIIAAGALYGWYRWSKHKQSKELEALLPTPVQAPPGFAPSFTKGFTPKPLSERMATIFNPATATTPFATQKAISYGKVPPPSDMPSSRVASSYYGAAAAPGPVSATPSTTSTASPTYRTATGTFNFKI